MKIVILVTIYFYQRVNNDMGINNAYIWIKFLIPREMLTLVRLCKLRFLLLIDMYNMMSERKKPIFFTF